MTPERTVTFFPALLAASVLLSGCHSLRSPPPSFPETQHGGAAGPAQPPAAGSAAPSSQSRPLPKQFHLRPASAALVAQSHTQMNGGDFGLAAATIERAMRIEPDNPLLWIELGRIRLAEGNASQADSMGRKALALATGDVQAQSSSYRLMGDALRALRRNEEAADADKRANALSPR